MTTNKILIIEDEISSANIIAGYIESDGYTVRMAHTAKDGLNEIEGFNPDVLLLDHNLPDSSGLDIISRLRRQDWSGGIIMITGETSLKLAVEAMKIGADDFVAKPFNPERLHISLKTVLEKRHLNRQSQSFQDSNNDNFQNFIGRSSLMQTVFNILGTAASSNAPVFITGESGTGKELAARAVHNLSKRKEKPFEVINCAAIPHNLLESEIFGHTKGAFTGATETREGVASRADGGTLFLDELGEMPIDLQPKLLRFIQTGTYMPVGGTTEKKADIRFVSATNRDAIDAVMKGLIREDLYYRLSVIPVELPPLRERGNDILILADSFLKKYSKEEQKAFREVSVQAQKLLLSVEWPGNVRQLQNTIREAVIMNDDSVLTDTMLLPMVERRSSVRTEGDHPERRSNTNRMSFSASAIEFLSPQDIQAFEKYERAIIEAAVKVCDGHVSKAAKLLQINPSTLYRKQQKWSEE